MTPTAHFNADATPRYWHVGDRRYPDQTARFILRSSFVRDARQTLIFAARKFRRFNEARRVWDVVDDAEIEAGIYRVLADGRWAATPQHVRRILKVFRLGFALAACAGVRGSWRMMTLSPLRLIETEFLAWFATLGAQPRHDRDTLRAMVRHFLYGRGLHLRSKHVSTVVRATERMQTAAR